MIQGLLKKHSQVSRLSNIMMLLTSVHHIYGAVIYHTPFRLHILFVSIPVVLFTILFDRKLKKLVRGNIWFLLYASIILICSILLIGFYEGIYNHILKNIAFFSGLSREKMNVLFPPPVYELPNDFFFELTGILQGLLAIWLAVRFSKLLRSI